MEEATTASLDGGKPGSSIVEVGATDSGESHISSNRKYEIIQVVEAAELAAEQPIR